MSGVLFPTYGGSAYPQDDASASSPLLQPLLTDVQVEPMFQWHPLQAMFGSQAAGATPSPAQPAAHSSHAHPRDGSDVKGQRLDVYSR